MKTQNTTVKLEKETKERLEKLKEHKRETFDELVKKILRVLNIVKADPDKARSILEDIDRTRKRWMDEERERAIRDGRIKKKVRVVKRG